MAELQDNMPPGWECKMDYVTGKYYFINHSTKVTTWEDPRGRYRPLYATPRHFTNMTVDHIPLQHGSPDLRRNYVYPSQPSPIPAFQMPGHHSPKSNPLQEMRVMPRSSPLAVRSARVQDSTFTTNVDTEDGVAKIGAMFPTVPETHIKMLMKKYHNREALVISALQVEKNPITTPGPYATPPPQRNIQHPNVQALHMMTPPLGGLARAYSRGGSPVLRPGSGTNSTYTGSPRIGDAYRSSPRPHSSPKLKLRYMKSLFPQAEEMMILEVLQNNESNIQKSSEVLKEMGFQRKDTVKAAQQKMEAKIEQERQEEIRKSEPPAPLPKLKTTQEKNAIKDKLKDKYKDVAEHLITMALESVDFNEKRASQILDIMVQEDTDKNAQSTSQQVEATTAITQNEPKPTSLPVSQSRQSIKSLIKPEKSEIVGFSRVIEELSAEYKSALISNTKGPNSDLAKGPGVALLDDYVDWQGPNKAIWKGSAGLAKGANRSLLTNRTYQPCGSNASLRKGPKGGLAKGSVFSQLKSIVVGESRGK